MLRCARLLSLLFALAIVAGLVCRAGAEDPAAKAVSSGQNSTAARKAAAKTCLLRYRFRTNQIVHLQVSQKTSIFMKKGPAEEKNTHESLERKHFRVVSADATGGGILEPVIDSVRMHVQFGNTPQIKYDSRAGGKPPRQFRALAKTLGKPTARMKFSAMGRLISTVRVLPAKLQARVAANVGAPAKPDNHAGKNFLIVFPEKPVRVGEEWTDKSLSISLAVSPTSRLRKEFQLVRRYRLTSVDNGLATISLRTSSLTPASSPFVRSQLVYSLPTGTIVFDTRTGLIIHRKLTIHDQVVGFAGPQSRLTVTAERVERVVAGSNSK